MFGWRQQNCVEGPSHQQTQRGRRLTESWAGNPNSTWQLAYISASQRKDITEIQFRYQNVCPKSNRDTCLVNEASESSEFLRRKEHKSRIPTMWHARCSQYIIPTMHHARCSHYWDQQFHSIRDKTETVQPFFLFIYLFALEWDLVMEPRPAWDLRSSLFLSSMAKTFRCATNMSPWASIHEQKHN